MWWWLITQPKPIWKKASPGLQRTSHTESRSGLTSSTPMVRTHTLDLTPVAPGPKTSVTIRLLIKDKSVPFCCEWISLTIETRSDNKVLYKLPHCFTLAFYCHLKLGSSFYCANSKIRWLSGTIQCTLYQCQSFIWLEEAQNLRIVLKICLWVELNNCYFQKVPSAKKSKLTLYEWSVSILLFRSIFSTSVQPIPKKSPRNNKVIYYVGIHYIIRKCLKNA